MHLGTILKRVQALSLQPGDYLYVNLASQHPVCYTVLWVGKDAVECITKSGCVRRFRCSEFWLDVTMNIPDESSSQEESF